MEGESGSCQGLFEPKFPDVGDEPRKYFFTARDSINNHAWNRFGKWDCAALFNDNKECFRRDVS